MADFKHRTQCMMSLLLKLLLIASIIAQNEGATTTTTTTTPMSILAFTVELSSPAPFSTSAPLVTTATTDKATTISLTSTSLSSDHKSAVQDEEDTKIEVLATDNLDYDISTVESTSGTNAINSVEQHDQPLPQIPPTTLSFANVIESFDIATTQTQHAVPPFYSVDDKYGN